MTITPERPTRPRTVHDLGRPREGWWNTAACKGMDTEAWIVAKEESRGGAGSSHAAMRICRSCPVQRDCLIDAVQSDDRRSIRGAMGVAERDEWLKEQGVHRRPTPYGGNALFVGSRGPYRAVDMTRLITMHLAGTSQQVMSEALGCAKETVARRLKAARAEGLIP
jgi:hypothetical protein